MSKAVEGRWSLKDRVTPAIQNMNKETLKYKATVKQARKSISDDWDHLKTGIKVAAAVTAGGIIAIGAFAKNMADEARGGIEASTKLSAVLHNVKGVTDQQIEGLKDYASALKNLGVVDDDVIVSGIQQLGTFQLQASTIKDLMPGMADLIAQQKGVNATQEDAVNIGNLFGKAMTGQTGALSRVGISFSAVQANMLKYGNESQKAAVLAEVLKQNVGGVNKALAGTDLGKIKQTTMAIEDMKKGIGKVVLLIEGKFAGAFMNNLPQIQSAVQSVADRIENWANTGGVERLISSVESAGNTIKGIYNDASAVYSFFKDNWSLIGPIVYGVVGALAYYKFYTVTAAASTLLLGKEGLLAAAKTAIMGTAALVSSGQLTIMGAAQRGLNAAMKANPIGTVITILGLLVLAGTYVVQNWETIKLVGMNTWNTVVDAAQWGVNKYIDFANTMIRVYAFAWDSIKYAGISIWDSVVDAAQGSVQNLLTPINAVRKALGKDAIEVNFSSVKGVAVKPVWDSSFNAIPQVNFGGAKFGQDQIMSQTVRAQQERDKKNAAEMKAMDDNTKALLANTGATDNNTDGTNSLSGTLQNGVSVNMTGEQIADGLFPRLERHLYGTT